MNILYSFIGSGLVLLLFYLLYRLASFAAARFIGAGAPECWFVSGSGWHAFRLVIRNIPSKQPLLEVRWRAWTRRSVPPSPPSVSVYTHIDEDIGRGERIMLPAGNDEVMTAFRVEQVGTELKFVLTNKLGESVRVYDPNDVEDLHWEYSFEVKRWFLLFKNRISRHVLMFVGHDMKRASENEIELFDRLDIRNAVADDGTLRGIGWLYIHQTKLIREKIEAPVRCAIPLHRHDDVSPAI